MSAIIIKTGIVSQEIRITGVNKTKWLSRHCIWVVGILDCFCSRAAVPMLKAEVVGLGPVLQGSAVRGGA